MKRRSGTVCEGARIEGRHAWSTTWTASLDLQCKSLAADAIAEARPVGSRQSTDENEASDEFRANWQGAMNKYIERMGCGSLSARMRLAIRTSSKPRPSDFGHEQQSTTKRVYQRKPVEVEVLDRR